MKLKTIQDSNLIQELLGQSQDFSHDMVAWDLPRGSWQDWKVSWASPIREKQDLYVKTMEDQGISFAQQLLVNPLGHFYISSSSFLFSCYLKERKGRRFRFSFPSQAAIIERRADKRIRPGVRLGLEIKGLDCQIKREVHDLSLGGASFLCTKAQCRGLSVGDRFSQVKILYGQSTAECSAEIADIQQVGPNEENGILYKGHKVSLRFDPMAYHHKAQLAWIIDSMTKL